MIRASDRLLGVVVATAITAADVIARGGLNQLSMEMAAATVTDSARMASSILMAIDRHMAPQDRKK